MSLPILVTGGTGVLGGHVVSLLRSHGHQVRVLSRRQHTPAEGVEYVPGDLLKNVGIEDAVAGISTVLHLAGGPKGDEAATRHLVQAAHRAGVTHVVYISIIAVDRIPLGYYRAKLASERVVMESGIPWSTLRAAQFHDLVLTVTRSLAKFPLVPAPGGIRLQPIDSYEVATRLVELALGRPSGLATDLAGPRVYELSELVRSYLRGIGKGRVMLPVRVPGRIGRLYRAGANLSLENVHTGERTWEDFLADQVVARR